jgi:peptidoglycan/LPS O-acetylase OafA/YrhL
MTAGTTITGGTMPARDHSPERLSALDGLRGLAACGVALLYHAQALFVAGGVADQSDVLHWFHRWGWTLVDLFFLISGYIFAHVYLSDEKSLTRANLRDFAVARIARLYPLHLLMLVLCAVLFAARPDNTAFAFVANLLMIQQFVPGAAHTFNGPSWSISVEVVCYVVFALAAARGPQVLRRICIAAVAIAVLWLLIWGRPGGPWFGDELPRGLLGFFLGQLMWMARGRLADMPSALLLCLFALGLMLDLPTISPILALTLYSWPALLLLAMRMKWMGSAPMRWLGDRSYAVYLVHQPIVLLTERHFGLFAADLQTFVGVTVALGAVLLLVADLVHRLLEVPARRVIRTAWVARRGPTATAVSAV